MALRSKCAVLRSTTVRQECKPTFTKEEWDALRIGTELHVNDFVKSGDHYFVLSQIGVGDNKAARHISAKSAAIGTGAIHKRCPMAPLAGVHGLSS